MATAWDPGRGESIFTRRRQRQRRSTLTFAYDVGVNLLANTLWVSIIWLIAQGTGVVRKNPAVTALALIVLYSVVLVLCGMAYRTGVLWVKRGRRWQGASLIVSDAGVGFAATSALLAYLNSTEFVLTDFEYYAGLSALHLGLFVFLAAIIYGSVELAGYPQSRKWRIIIAVVGGLLGVLWIART